MNPQYVHNKLVDLEDRSSSNNLRIYGIKGKEGRIEDWEDCEAEVEKRFREKLQAFTKYLRQTLAFAWNSALREKWNSVFQEIFASTEKIFISGGGLSTRQ